MSEIPDDVKQLAIDIHLSERKAKGRTLGLTDYTNVIAKAILAERERGEKALEEANRRATDLRYMRDAYWTMLGPVGLKVAAMWHEKRVKRVHHSWGPEAHKLTGEERAEHILQLEEATKTAVEWIDNEPAALVSEPSQS